MSADACLVDDDVQSLTQCIRLNLDCADVCVAAGRLAAEACRRCDNACEEAIRSLPG